MSKIVDLKVGERDTTLTPRQLRSAGYIPVTLCGKGIESVCLQVNSHDFTQAYLQGVRGFHLTGYLDTEAEVKDLQLNAMNRSPISIQFQQVGGGKTGKSKSK